MGFFKRRYFVEKTLGKYFKLMFTNFSTEEFRLRTPSLEICYDKNEDGTKGVFLDLFFWSVDLYFYPNGDSANDLDSGTPHPIWDKDEELTKDNVAFRDVLQD